VWLSDAINNVDLQDGKRNRTIFFTSGEGRKDGAVSLLVLKSDISY
jgi:hypothetical protein